MPEVSEKRDQKSRCLVLEREEKDMEEQKKETQEQQEAKNQLDQRENSQGLPTRSYIIQLLAGAYLLYTGYQLCRGVINGDEGASGGFMIAGILFLIVGVLLLINGGKNVFIKDRAKKAEEAGEKSENISREKEAVPEEKTPKMTIAQRANLAQKLQEEENSPEKDEETSQEDSI